MESKSGGSEDVVQPLLLLRKVESYAMAAFEHYGVRERGWGIYWVRKGYVEVGMVRRKGACEEWTCGVCMLRRNWFNFYV